MEALSTLITGLLQSIPDPVALINATLQSNDIQLPASVRSIQLVETTVWPFARFIADLPWIFGALAMAILGTLTARSLRIGIIAGILSLVALYPSTDSSGLITLTMSLAFVASALLVGLFLGYLHAAHPLIRIITWPALWLLLTLPILGVVAIATGVIAPQGYLVQAILLLSAPVGVMARGSALVLQEIDPELRVQAERLGAGHAQQVRLLSLPMSAHSIRSVIHNSVMVFFAVLVAMGSLGIPGISQDIWAALAGKDPGTLIVATIRLWLLAVSVDLVFRFMGLGRLRRLQEAL